MLDSDWSILKFWAGATDIWKHSGGATGTCTRSKSSHSRGTYVLLAGIYSGIGAARTLELTIWKVPNQLVLPFRPRRHHHQHQHQHHQPHQLTTPLVIMIGSAPTAYHSRASRGQLRRCLTHCLLTQRTLGDSSYIMPKPSTRRPQGVQEVRRHTNSRHRIHLSLSTPWHRTNHNFLER